jgi:hypothetical protein
MFLSKKLWNEIPSGRQDFFPPVFMDKIIQQLPSVSPTNINGQIFLVSFNLFPCESISNP